MGSPTFGRIGANYGNNIGRTAFNNDIALGVVNNTTNSGIVCDVTVGTGLTHVWLIRFK